MMQSKSSRPKSILVICPFPLDIAPAQRLKYEQYFDHWRANGYSVTVSPFMSRDLFDVAWKRGFLGRKILGTLAGTLRRWRDFLRIRKDVADAAGGHRLCKAGVFAGRSGQ